MANSLLDFVMSLVRDPDAAARYAADPAAAITDAGLPDVTSADVDQLIPVVAESVSSAVPGLDATSWAGSVPSVDGVDGNVWASGAATAAFDAFGIEDSTPVIADGRDDVAVHDVHTVADDVPALIPDLDDVYADVPVSSVIDDVAGPAGLPGLDWDTAPDASAPHESGFDIFD
ncbi:Rv0340 family protein [Mycobacterium sp. MBM]|nr:Rv0340 family protein [Mycobacterium sp. MBM]